jgi:outer membrane autotransporter protein
MSFNSPNAVMLRSGLRLAHQDQYLQPFLRTNFWSTFAGNDGVRFDNGPSLNTKYDNTTIQLGGGFVWKISSRFGAEASIDYVTQSQDQSLNGMAGSVQLRLGL